MLRDYQIEMKTRLMEAWKAHRSVMVQMPTGTGKTHLLASVVSEFVSSAGSGVWLIAHRRELVAQMEETLAKYGIRRDKVKKYMGVFFSLSHILSFKCCPR